RPDPGAVALRRADRPSRLRHRRPRPRSALGAPRALWLRPRDRHPRPRCGESLRAGGRAHRRPRHRWHGMSAAIQLGLARLRRRPGGTLTQGLVLAIAVALLGAMILFIGHSLRTMTASATRSVPLDLQGPVSDYGKARRLAA